MYRHTCTVYIYIFTYICIFTFIYICIYTFIYIYIHTHIYIHLYLYVYICKENMRLLQVSLCFLLTVSEGAAALMRIVLLSCRTDMSSHLHKGVKCVETLSLHGQKPFHGQVHFLWAMRPAEGREDCTMSVDSDSSVEDLQEHRDHRPHSAAGSSASCLSGIFQFTADFRKVVMVIFFFFSGSGYVICNRKTWFAR